MRKHDTREFAKGTSGISRLAEPHGRITDQVPALSQGSLLLIDLRLRLGRHARGSPPRSIAFPGPDFSVPRT
jgi:hypothetical protein